MYSKNIALAYPCFKEHAYSWWWQLGLGYIASYLKINGHKVKIFHSRDYNYSSDKMLEDIRKFSPDYVGVYVNHTMREMCIEFLKLLKRNNFSTLVGGPDPTIRPEMYTDYCDYVVMGEGEITFSEFLIREEPVKGIALLKNGKLYIAGKRDLIENLDELPFPEGPRQESFQIITSRGCPFQCSFCQPMIHKLFGRKVRFRSPKNVVDEIEERVKFGGKECFFDDDIFTLKREHTLGICDGLIKRNLGLIWTAQTRAELIDREMLEYMKKAGCRTLKFGIESGSPRILEDIYNKKITLQQVRRAFRLCKEVGIRAVPYIMIGAPTEGRKDLELTLKLLKDIDPDGVHVSITTLLPNTFLYERYSHLLSEEEKNTTYAYAVDNPDLCKKYIDKGINFSDVMRYKSKFFKIVIKKSVRNRPFLKKCLSNFYYLFYAWSKYGRQRLERTSEIDINQDGDLMGISLPSLKIYIYRKLKDIGRRILYAIFGTKIIKKVKKWIQR